MKNAARPTDTVALHQFYERSIAAETAMSPHLERLKKLATGLDDVIELGVKNGGSTSALLLGAKHVVSYDLQATPQALKLKAIAGDRWDYRIGDSRAAVPSVCDLLFVDSRHTYEQVSAELRLFADMVRLYIAFHDTITFGSYGANGETGYHSWGYTHGKSVPHEHLGIRPAIDELMIRDHSWRIVAHHTDSHGLLVLARS